MTDRVQPSLDADIESRWLAAAIEFQGSGSDGEEGGWVVPASDDPHRIAEGHPDIDHTALNAFAESHASDSLELTIDPGQAFLGGAWLARDHATTVTLDANSTQGIRVGWDTKANNTIKITVSATSGADRNPRHKLYTVETDGSGVTSVTDERNLDDYRVRDADLTDNVVTVDRITHEFGTFTGDSMSSTATETVTFNNTYVAGSVSKSLQFDLDDAASLPVLVWDGWQFDSDFNHTGMDVKYKITDAAGAINWQIQGTEVP